MTPKKVKQLLPGIAIENKEDITLLTKLTNFYWDEVREILSTSTENRVNIINMGVFVRKAWTVDKQIKKTEDTLAALEKTNRHAVIENLRKDLQHLYNVKKSLQESDSRKQEIKLKRDEYNKNLEKQG